MTELAVDVDGLRQRYGTFEAVRGVSLQVQRGELFALLGVNGAGKTTTIELLEGLQRPTGGRVRVLGLDPIRDRRVVRPRTGMMLQEGGLTGSFTVRETVDIWRSLTAHPRLGAEAVEMVGLDARADVSVERLSGGERRRLELALAVLGRPELVFLDEPTTGMDPASRRRTWDVLRELQRAGTTLLLTTHYLEEAEALADRVAIMRDGCIVIQGEPSEVVQALPAQITFDLPHGAPTLPDLQHAARSVDGVRVTYLSQQLQPDLSSVLGWAEEHGLELKSLAARSASLEDVFLNVADDDGATRRPTTSNGR